MYIVIFVSPSIKLFKFVIKTSWWTNTKKCWEKQRRRAPAKGSAVRFIALKEFFLHFLRPKDKLKKKWITSKNGWLWSDFTHRTALFFLSLLLSSSTFSHTKSVIIAQETRNTVTMLSLFLQKHDNYRKLSSILFFFVILWHHERQGGGGSLGGFRWALKSATGSVWPAQKTHTGADYWSRFVCYASVCLSEDVSSSEHLHCQVR